MIITKIIKIKRVFLVLTIMGLVVRAFKGFIQFVYEKQKDFIRRTKLQRKLRDLLLPPFMQRIYFIFMKGDCVIRYAIQQQMTTIITIFIITLMILLVMFTCVFFSIQLFYESSKITNTVIVNTQGTLNQLQVGFWNEIVITLRGKFSVWFTSAAKSAAIEAARRLFFLFIYYYYYYYYYYYFIFVQFKLIF